MPWRKPSGLVPSAVFKENSWAFLGPCVRGRGRPWYCTSAQPESHFTCSSPRCAPRVVPSAFLLNYFWVFLRVFGGARGRPWYGTLARTQVTSRKACLRNAEQAWTWVDYLWLVLARGGRAPYVLPSWLTKGRVIAPQMCQSSMLQPVEFEKLNVCTPPMPEGCCSFCTYPLTHEHYENQCQSLFSSGPSGGCLHRGASFQEEKAHFTAQNRVRRTAKMK